MSCILFSFSCYTLLCYCVSMSNESRKSREEGCREWDGIPSRISEIPFPKFRPVRYSLENPHPLYSCARLLMFDEHKVTNVTQD
jgi:hypothetical protein